MKVKQLKDMLYEMAERMSTIRNASILTHNEKNGAIWLLEQDCFSIIRSLNNDHENDEDEIPF